MAFRVITTPRRAANLALSVTEIRERIGASRKIHPRRLSAPGLSNCILPHGNLATLAAIRRASTVLLFWHRVVEFSVVEQQTTLRRNAGDVLVTMMPADIARGIGVTRMEQLGRGVIKTADIEH